MTRQALTCPSCGRTLAYKRRGGSVVPESRVAAHVADDDAVVLWCPTAGCAGYLALAGGWVVITPRRRDKIAVK